MMERGSKCNDTSVMRIFSFVTSTLPYDVSLNASNQGRYFDIGFYIDFHRPHRPVNIGIPIKKGILYLLECYPFFIYV